LIGKDESIESFVWSQKGDSLYYTRVDYETKTSKLCQFNFTTEKCFQIELKGNWDVLDSNKETLLLKYWKASSSQNLYLYNAQTGKLTPLDEKGNSRKAFFVGDKVFWTSDVNPDHCKSEPCILSFDLRKKSFNQLNLPKNLLSINDIKMSPDGKHLLVQDITDSVDNLRIFRLGKNKIEKEIPRFISDSFVIWNTRWLSDKEIFTRWKPSKSRRQSSHTT
jgi:hypothetical protein